MAQVQFNAKFGKLTLASKNKVELELPEGMQFAKIAEIASFKGHDIIVQFGNPQVEMLFDHQPGGRMVARVDGQGVVEGVQRAGSDPDEPTFEDDGEATDDNPVAGTENDGLSEEDELDFGDDGSDGESGEQEDGDAADPEEEQEGEEDESEAASAVGKGELEEFIIDVRPTYPDVPFDFPSILERKNETGETWIEIAKAVGTSSSKLQTAYGKYKARVRMLILEQRGDVDQEGSNGAA